VRRAACAGLVVLASLAAVRPGRADDDAATAAARSHYEMGLRLFDAREHEQALIEFEQANDIKSRPAALFMMAQCEYLLGRLKVARAHYQRYVEQNPDGEFAALARDRVGAIDKRPSVFVINSVPDDVTVRISPEGETGHVIAAGQAPNNFSVPRGRYRVDVSKPSFQGQTRFVELDLAETKPLFFKLEPIPARLEIETWPKTATLYVNGNRARNPYRQDLAPGPVEIFAEAPDYEPRTVDLTLAASERKLLTGPDGFRLAYRQRSGRSDLILSSALLGALVGAGAVAAAIGKNLEERNVGSVLLATGGGVSGFVLGALVATPLVPEYIPDNRALFIIGAMWIGAVEGFGASVVGYQLVSRAQSATPPCAPEPCRAPLGDQLRVGFIGSLAGLGLGLTTGALSAQHAPTYGRAALIQSTALGGALAGALFQVGAKWKPYGAGWQRDLVVSSVEPMLPGGCVVAPNGTTMNCAVSASNVLDLTPGTLIGLNVGLAAGLLGAYLPDQSRYGPTWQRVLFVDLATGAGAIAGGVFGCVGNVNGCLKQPNPSDQARSIAAWSALVGAGVGAVAGVIGTRGLRGSTEPSATAPLPVATIAPLRDATGALVPAVAAAGTF
jgi:hypothetical protein